MQATTDKTTAAVSATLVEEVTRQRRTMAEVIRTAGVHRNVINKMRTGTITVPTLWRLCEALSLPVSDLAYRVEKRMQETNDDSPFRPGERVRWRRYTATVLTNEGERGRVSIDGWGERMWYWNDDPGVRRVKP